MSVEELTCEELEELKDSFYYDCLYGDAEPPFALEGANEEMLRDYEFPCDIPDEVIFDYFGGICFGKGDFFCNMV